MTMYDDVPGAGILPKLYSRPALAGFGVLLVAILVALVGITVAVYDHAFDDSAAVTLQADRAGSQLDQGADVKLHGIVVGRVTSIDSDGDGATLHLAIEHKDLHLIPSNVTAQILPKTLFGESYVDLDLPTQPAADDLKAGDVIARDDTTVAVELTQALDDLEPLLSAVQPAKLNSTLTALATALNGRGTELGQTIATTNDYLAQALPSVPQLVKDASLTASVSDDYTKAADPLLRTLANVTVTANTISEKSQQIAQLLGSSITFAQQAQSFVNATGSTLVNVVGVSQPVLELYAKYAPELACTINGATIAKSRLEAVFDSGPYLKASLYVVESRGQYVDGKDSPTVIDMSKYGPYCPVTPKNGQGTVPNPPIPSELDEVRGTPNPLNAATLQGTLSGILGAIGGLTGTSASASSSQQKATTPSTTSSSSAPVAVPAPAIVQLLLGGLQP